MQLHCMAAWMILVQYMHDITWYEDSATSYMEVAMRLPVLQAAVQQAARQYSRWQYSRRFPMAHTHHVCRVACSNVSLYVYVS